MPQVAARRHRISHACKMLTFKRILILEAIMVVGCAVNARPIPDSTDWTALGRSVYDTHCRGCHGESGDGQGPAATLLYPRPRDFQHDGFRIRSTLPQTPPSDADLLAVLTMGVPGSPMPSFAFLKPSEQAAVIGYLKSLSPQFSTKQPPIAFDTRTPPPTTIASISAGKVLYHRLGCGDCHGEEGRGDGEMANDLLDSRGLPIRCRDLVHDAYKGGTSVRDIYLRLSSGMDGTPMPNLAEDTATSAERWQLAAYVASLRENAPVIQPSPHRSDRVIVSSRARKHAPTTEPLADDWNLAPPSMVQLFPLATHMSRKSHPSFVSVRSLHDQRTIAFRLEWTDATRDDQANGTEKFADAAAIQFLAGESGTFLGMGAQLTPVRIWHWKADWQREVDTLRSAASTVLVPSDKMATPVPVLAARQANNPYVISNRPGPVEEGMAAGFGTFTAGPVQC